MGRDSIEDRLVRAVGGIVPAQMLPHPRRRNLPYGRSGVYLDG
jgi:hypothetical protein